MSKLIDCLSTLGIIATCADPRDAGGKARAVVDVYLTDADKRSDPVAALRELYDAFMRLPIDNEIFDEIQADIEARIVERTVGVELGSEERRAPQRRL